MQIHLSWFHWSLIVMNTYTQAKRYLLQKEMRGEYSKNNIPMLLTIVLVVQIETNQYSEVRLKDPVEEENVVGPEYLMQCENVWSKLL